MTLSLCDLPVNMGCLLMNILTALSISAFAICIWSVEPRYAAVHLLGELKARSIGTKFGRASGRRLSSIVCSFMSC